MDSKRRSQNTSKAFIIIFSLLLVSAPFVLLSSSFKAVVFDLNYYDERFEGLGVYSDPMFADADVLAETDNLLLYLGRGKGEIKTIQQDFFNDREKAHLSEVRDLFRVGLSLKRFFFFFTIVLLLLLFNMERDKESFMRAISKYLICGSLITIALLCLSLFIVFNFDSSFTTFHHILFEADTWLFDPQDRLVNMFPQQFFHDIFKSIISLASVISLISLGVGIILYNRPLLSGYYKRFITKKG